MTVGATGDPKCLTMGPYAYDIPDANPYTPGLPTEPPLKAKNVNAFIVKRMSSMESPNLFFSKNLSDFVRLSDYYPEREYNWLHNEIMTWKLKDGLTCQGILYKPENFDTAKRYPVIIYYYEKLSDQLHVFMEPGLSRGPINIPWFVSRGYLVFTPDIHYKSGELGESACNTVVSAAHFLSTYSFVDSRHMAIQGHSLGGYETNYIVTHSNIFSAAISAAGMSDCISDFGGLWGMGASKEGSYESIWGPQATVWEQPELFIRNSPIFMANKVVTPLLMMHNKNDGNVPFGQSIELFTALRHLGKRVWLLQYDGEAHTIGADVAAFDYTLRVNQFLDHYLKGLPAPKWMTEGIAANRKGSDLGLELDRPEVKP